MMSDQKRPDQVPATYQASYHQISYGGQGKAVGCVPPTALLFEQALSIKDQQNQTLNQHDCCHPGDGNH
jgi:hypothetical protein